MNAMWKKLLSLLLVLTMLVGLTPAVFASEEAAAEPAEQAEEMLPEESDEAEDPADADEPADPEDPDTQTDPETPAVTPEEPDTPGDPDTPEDPVPGEEPVTPEEPAEEPDAEEPAEETEDEGAEFGMDIEIQSEGLGERKLTPTDDLRFLQYHRYGLGPEMFDGGSIFVQIEWIGTDPKLAYAIAAESKTMRYYIDYHPKKDLIANTPLKPGEEFGRYYINLPAGEYSVRVIAWDPNAATPTYYASKQEKTLIVLPAPEVASVTPAAEDNGGSIALKALGNLNYAWKLLWYNRDDPACDPSDPDTLNTDDHNTLLLEGLSPGEYYLQYRGSSKTGEFSANVVVLDSAVTPASVPVQAGAWFFSPYIELGWDSWYPDDGPVPLYKGDEVRISTYVEGEDNRLSFKSDKPKVATVDAVGNVKAVGTGTAHITVESLADAYPGTYTFTVDVQDFSPKTFKFVKAKQTVEWNPYTAMNGANPTVTLMTDSKYQSDQVTYSVSGGEYGGLYFLDQDNDPVNTLTTDARTPELHLRAGGVYTVTAKLHGKTATCTVQADGFSASDAWARPTAESVFYSGGKAVKGWIAWDEVNRCYLFGKAALAGGSEALAQRANGIYYVGSDGKLLTEGVHSVNGKLYLFASPGRLSLHTDLLNGKEVVTADIVGLGGGEIGFQTEQGSLLTGWQRDLDGYYDPSDGHRVFGGWVPYGKGVTWVDFNGVAEDINGHSLLEKGIHVRLIGRTEFDTDGVACCFKDGVRYTGWVYAEFDGGDYAYTTKATKASLFKLYFDPNNSGQLVYFDPNNEGKVKVELAKPFWVDGKEYRYAKADSMMGVLLPTAFDLSAKTNLLVSQDGYWWVSAPDGSVIKSAMVDAYDFRGGYTGTVYAKSDGRLAWEQWVTVNGKSYYFGSDYLIQATEVTDTGLRVKINGGDFTQASSYSATDVVAKPVKEGKPKEGYCYYYNDEKLTNCILYENDYESLWVPVLALDKNGKPQKGPAVVSAYPYLYAPATESYVINKGGYVRYGCAEHNETNSVTFTEIKGKLYASYSDGRVLKNGVYNHCYGWNQDGTFCADKNGVLTRNTFKTIDVGKIYFGENGIVEDGSVLTVKGKTYLLKSKNSDEYGWVKVVSTDHSYYIFNSDGSVKLGWVTYPDKTKRYVTIKNSGSPYSDLLHNTLENMPSRIWKIDGKLYCLDRDGALKTGWMVLYDGVQIWDMALFIETHGYCDRICEISGVMYFDPKTGAAVTGGWKTVPKLLGSQAREKAFDENENIVPMDNSEKTAKYYFKEDGTIAKDEALEISGKLYHFNWDGTGAGIAGWVDAEKTQYRLKSGQLASGRTKVDNLWYFFDPATGRKATRQLRKTGGRWYYYNDLGVQDTVDVDYDLFEQRYTFGSTTGKDLRFVWNKDGSLAKVVYAAGGQPAAGESVSFGYAMEALVAGTGCGFVLDGKGLPMTGVVSGFNPGEGAGSYIPGYFDTCSIVVNADGSRLVCRDDMPSLVKVGSSYYVMNGSLIGVRGEAYAGWKDTFDYSRLPAADRALIEQWMTCCNGKLPICVNADGSLPQNTTVQLGWGTVHTTSLGICPEYAGLYKSGSKWYLDTYRMPPGVYDAWDRDSSIMIQIEFRVKDSGELTGVYDYQTGKALTGTYKLDGTNLVIFLKNGKPVTGKQTEPGSRTIFNIPKELGWVSLP